MTRIAKLLTLILLMGVFGNIATAQGVDEEEPAVTEAIDAATAGQAGEDDATLAPSDLVRPNEEGLSEEDLSYDPTIEEEFGESKHATYFLGVPVFDALSFWTTIFRFFFNVLVCWIIIHFFYYKKANRKDYYFTFMMFAVTIFLLITLMENMKMNIAFALGLFAIFGMIRYRTETIKIREMTYLFVIMGLSIINGQALTASWVELLVVNLMVILAVWILDRTKVLSHTATKIILYDKIENTKHGREEELKADLIERTGLDITKVEVGHIDYLRDVAFVKVYYRPIDGEVNTIDTVTKLKDFTD